MIPITFFCNLAAKYKVIKHHFLNGIRAVPCFLLHLPIGAAVYPNGSLLENLLLAEQTSLLGFDGDFDFMLHIITPRSAARFHA